MKYTYEEKIKYVKMYKKSEWIPLDPKAKCTLKEWHKTVKNWANIYDKFGKQGLMPKTKRKALSKEFKLAAVKRVLAGESAKSVTLSLGMGRNSRVANWVRTYKLYGEDGLKSKPRGRSANGKRSPANEGTGGEGGDAGEAEPSISFRELLLKKIEGLGGEGGASPRQKYEAILQVKDQFKEAKLIELLAIAEMPKSTFFYESKRKMQLSEGEAEARYLVIREYNRSRGRYGVRRVTEELHNQGVDINHKRVQRIMRLKGLKGLQPKNRYNSYHGTTGKVADDLIIMEYTRKDGQVHHKSDFSCDGPDKKWTTDVSQFNLAFGKCYLSTIKDMKTAEIISYNLSLSPNLEQVLDMLNKAFEKHENLKGLIFHSDQGWQYQHQSYIAELEKRGIRQSMSRKGNCLDNCIMESFFARMKTEMYFGKENKYRTFGEFKKAVEEYIYWYNNTRIRHYPDLKRWMTPTKCRELFEKGQL